MNAQRPAEGRQPPGHSSPWPFLSFPTSFLSAVRPFPFALQALGHGCRTLGPFTSSASLLAASRCCCWQCPHPLAALSASLPFPSSLPPVVAPLASSPASFVRQSAGRANAGPKQQCSSSIRPLAQQQSPAPHPLRFAPRRMVAGPRLAAGGGFAGQPTGLFRLVASFLPLCTFLPRPASGLTSELPVPRPPPSCPSSDRFSTWPNRMAKCQRHCESSALHGSAEYISGFNANDPNAMAHPYLLHWALLKFH